MPLHSYNHQSLPPLVMVRKKARARRSRLHCRVLMIRSNTIYYPLDWVLMIMTFRILIYLAASMGSWMWVPYKTWRNGEDKINFNLAYQCPNSTPPSFELGILDSRSLGAVHNEYLVSFEYFKRIMENYGFVILRIMENYGFVILNKEQAEPLGLPNGLGNFEDLFK